jgi:ACS family hexuronate transporter-like MFS transporter
MSGYIGGTLFSLVLGQLSSVVGYEPLFICLSIFDIVAFVIVALVLGERRSRTGYASGVASP